MSIRKAKPSESALLSAIAFESKSYWGYSPDFMDACRDELSVSTQNIESDTMNYQVYVEGDDIVGFYTTEKLSETEAELEALFVKPEYIGKGIGKLLMAHAVSYVKEQDFSLLTIQGDPNTTNFYLACDAKRIGEKASASIKEALSSALSNRADKRVKYITKPRNTLSFVEHLAPSVM